MTVPQVSPIQLEGGGRVETDGDRFDVIWADGSTLTIGRTGTHLNAYLMLARARAGSVRGLLGDFDGAPDNDLATSEGVVLDAPTDQDEIYDPFGRSWRVTQQESLFDYAEGQTTASFTDLAYPRASATIADLPDADRARAERLCREAGVTDPGFLEECIVDVGHSGDDAFAESTAGVQRTEAELRAAAAARLGPDPITSGLCSPSPEAGATAAFRGDVARTGRFPGSLPTVGGALLWSAPYLLAGQEPVVADGRVVIVGRNEISGFDEETGNLLWQSASPAGGVSGQGLVAAGGAVFVGWDEAFAAYDVPTGAECWHLPVATPTSASYRDGRIFVSVDEDQTGHVSAVDAPSGRILWRWNATNTAAPNWPNPSEPTLGDRALFVADADEVVALDPPTGSTLWRARVRAGVSPGMSYDDGTVFVPERTTGIQALDADTGEPLWRWTEAGGVVTWWRCPKRSSSSRTEGICTASTVAPGSSGGPWREKD